MADTAQDNKKHLDERGQDIYGEQTATFADRKGSKNPRLRENSGGRKT